MEDITIRAETTGGFSGNLAFIDGNGRLTACHQCTTAIHYSNRLVIDLSEVPNEVTRIIIEVPRT